MESKLWFAFFRCDPQAFISQPDENFLGIFSSPKAETKKNRNQIQYFWSQILVILVTDRLCLSVEFVFISFTLGHLLKSSF